MSDTLESRLHRILKSVLLEVANELFTHTQTMDRATKHTSHAPNLPVLLRTTDAAKMLAICDVQLLKLARAGTIPSVRIGRAIRFRPEALREWATKSESTEPPAYPASHARNAEKGRKVTYEKPPVQKKKRAARKRAPSKSTLKPNARESSNVTGRETTVQNRRSDSRQGNPPRSASEHFSKLLGFPKSEFPRLSNGDLMRIAEVDIATMHGWIYLGRDLPDEALHKLEAFFKKHFETTSTALKSSSPHPETAQR